MPFRIYDKCTGKLVKTMSARQVASALGTDEDELQWISNMEPLFEGQSDGEDDPGPQLAPIVIDDPLMGDDDPGEQLIPMSNPDPLLVGYEDFMARIGGLG